MNLADGLVTSGNLVLRASSSNLNLIPNANIVLGGGGSSRTVQVTTAADQCGVGVVTLTVDNGQSISNTATSSFKVTVAAATPMDGWREQYFGTTANVDNAADSANPSGDGLSNLLKYALGLNPLTATANPVNVDVEAGHLRLTVPTNPNATDVTYSVQVNGDLTNAAGWTTMGTTVDQNTAKLLQVHDNMSIKASPQRFIRLQIIR